MKRKAEAEAESEGEIRPKKRVLSDEEVRASFRPHLFENAELQKYTEEYANSQPYVTELSGAFIYLTDCTATSMG